MKWITRERPVIDRIACPWLVARFIDKEAEFLFVPPADVIKTAEETGAIPYDVPGVELTHVGEGCSFDSFLQKYGLEKDPAILTIAGIVRGADTDRHDSRLRRPAWMKFSPGRPSKAKPRTAFQLPRRSGSGCGCRFLASAGRLARSR